MVEVFHYFIYSLLLEQLQKSLVAKSDLLALPSDCLKVFDDDANIFVLLQLGWESNLLILVLAAFLK